MIFFIEIAGNMSGQDRIQFAYNVTQKLFGSFELFNENDGNGEGSNDEML